jgi:esterase/lipase
MGAFIARQPNGRLCRFSTVVDTVTAYNMTEQGYIEMCAERARVEAKDVIENYLRPFEEVKERFYPNNMTQEEFNEILKEMEEPV